MTTHTVETSTITAPARPSATRADESNLLTLGDLEAVVGGGGGVGVNPSRGAQRACWSA